MSWSITRLTAICECCPLLSLGAGLLLIKTTGLQLESGQAEIAAHAHIYHTQP